MNTKRIVGLILMAIGSSIAIFGVLNSKETILNIGICGIFIGAVLFSFSQQKTQLFFEAYHENLKNLAKFLDIKKAIYIPQNKYLSKGGLFLPIKEDFDIDLARMNYEAPIISGREREAGILLKIPGSEIIETVEEISFESISSALKSANLIKSANFLQNEGIRIFVEGVAVNFCEEDCKKVACPICATLLLSLANELGELIEVSNFKVGKRIEIIARKIGGVEKWM